MVLLLLLLVLHTNYLAAVLSQRFVPLVITAAISKETDVLYWAFRKHLLHL